jgi:glutamine amidotransferase
MASAMQDFYMCRILSIKNFGYTEHKQLLENFFVLAENGKVPPKNPKGHLDGWGIGWYEGKTAKLYKSGNSVVEEKEKFFSILEEIKETKILIVHFRKSAWENTNSPKNSHPFKYKNILFAHNGTIHNYKKILSQINHPRRVNMLDSEAFFYLIVSMNEENLKEKFKKAVEEIKIKCDYSSLTCVFSDGENLYAYRSFTKLKDYYTLYYTKTNNSFFICSEPIGKDLNWKILKKEKLFVI